jgi:hypothetical protein
MSRIVMYCDRKPKVMTVIFLLSIDMVAGGGGTAGGGVAGGRLAAVIALEVLSADTVDIWRCCRVVFCAFSTPQ